MRKSLLIFLATTLGGFWSCTSAQSKAAYCSKPHGFEERLQLYEGCIAKAASEFEVTGDTAESVAIAALGACDRMKRWVAEYIDECGGTPNVGLGVMNDEEKTRFRDYAVQSVITFRAARLKKEKP